MDQQAQAHNEQPGHVIERTDSPQPLYFSEKIGRDFAQPNGGWTGERDKATVMAAEVAEERLRTSLAQLAPSCKVVPL